LHTIRRKWLIKKDLVHSLLGRKFREEAPTIIEVHYFGVNRERERGEGEKEGPRREERKGERE
jgi:hypothetical protein